MGEAIISPGARWEHLLGVQNESNAFVTVRFKASQVVQVIGTSLMITAGLVEAARIRTEEACGD